VAARWPALWPPSHHKRWPAAALPVT